MARRPRKKTTPTKTKRHPAPASARGAALRRLAAGAKTEEVARAVGVTVRTVRKWRREAELNPVVVALCGCRPPTQREMARIERLWLFAVTKALVEKAQEGDVRACDMVLKLLNQTKGAEGSDERGAGAAGARLERELSKLPASVAAEIVGLLAQVGPSPAGGDRVPDKAASGKAVGTLELPWSEDSDASDKGRGGV
jgi:hypothetical protein